MKAGIHCVILAGGRGKRFWPLSRRKAPKPFLPLFDGKSLLRMTLDRLLPLCSPGQILIVGDREHEELLRKALGEIPGENLLLEPFPRNTAASVALAALEVKRRAGNPPILVAPVDHFIGDPEAFQAEVREGSELCGEYLVALGVKPKTADTGFGYIEAGEKIASGRARRVISFHEKPSREHAERLVQNPATFWNSGIFLWTPSRILEAMETYLPRLGGVLGELEKALGKGSSDLLEGVYRNLEDISVDRGVLERAANVAVLPVKFSWSDVGSWSGLGPLLPELDGSNRGTGKILTLNAENNLVVHPGGLTALIGVRDLVVVYSAGVLLVCPRERCQEVKDLVEILERNKEEEYL